MPTSDSTVLLDTSAALAYLDMDHRFHAEVDAATEGRMLGLAGHAVFEAYSVVTRQPAPKRISPFDARRILESEFPATHHLGAAAAAALVADLPGLGISGGAVYDALVAAAAKEAGLPLVSCDVRAAETYAVLGVAFDLMR